MSVGNVRENGEGDENLKVTDFAKQVTLSVGRRRKIREVNICQMLEVFKDLNIRTKGAFYGIVRMYRGRG